MQDFNRHNELKLLRTHISQNGFTPGYLILYLPHKILRKQRTMQTQIHQFNNADRQWLAQGLSIGREICTRYLTEKAIDAEALDRVFALWAASSAGTKEFSANDVAHGLGCLFGELLQKQFRFSWCRIEDRFGNEQALLDEATGSIVMPVNAVYKRIEPELQQQPFFAPMWQMITAHLEKNTNKSED